MPTAGGDQRGGALPATVVPMLAVAGSVPSGPGRVYEVGWDGVHRSR